jgi:hypothetical protein
MLQCLMLYIVGGKGNKMKELGDQIDSCIPIPLNQAEQKGGVG